MASTDTPLFGGYLVNADGSVMKPWHCGQPMADDGDCGEGCCDDYKCSVCGATVRIEWPD